MSRDTTLPGPGGSTAPPSRDGLPLYPWNRERFWFERTVEASNLIDPPFDHPLLGFRQDGAVRSWLNHLDADILPWLADHAVEGVPVLPGAAVVEMALAAARLRRPDAAAIEVSDVELRRPLPFEKGRAREIRSIEIGEDGDWELTSRPRLADDPPTLHAVARLATAGDFVPPPLFGPAGPSRGEIDAAALYGLAARLGLDYGGRFRTVRRIELLGAGTRRWRNSIRSVIDEPLAPYIVHPALLDGALQGLLALIADRQAGHSGDLAGASFLPWRFGRVRAPAPFGRVPHSARLRVTRVGTRSAAADIALFDEAGAIVAELSDCWFRRVELTRRAAPDEAALRVDLVPAPLGEDAAPAVLAAIADIVGPLAAIPDGRGRGAGRTEIAAGRADRLGTASRRCCASSMPRSRSRSTRSSKTARSPPMPRRFSAPARPAASASGRPRRPIGSGRSTAKATCPPSRKSGACCLPNSRNWFPNSR